MWLSSVKSSPRSRCTISQYDKTQETTGMIQNVEYWTEVLRDERPSRNCISTMRYSAPRYPERKQSSSTKFDYIRMEHILLLTTLLPHVPQHVHNITSKNGVQTNPSPHSISKTFPGAWTTILKGKRERKNVTESGNWNRTHSSETTKNGIQSCHGRRVI